MISHQATPRPSALSCNSSRHGYITSLFAEVLSLPPPTQSTTPRQIAPCSFRKQVKDEGILLSPPQDRQSLPQWRWLDPGNIATAIHDVTRMRGEFVRLAREASRDHDRAWSLDPAETPSTISDIAGWSGMNPHARAARSCEHLQPHSRSLAERFAFTASRPILGGDSD